MYLLTGHGWDRNLSVWEGNSWEQASSGYHLREGLAFVLAQSSLDTFSSLCRHDKLGIAITAAASPLPLLLLLMMLHVVTMLLIRARSLFVYHPYGSDDLATTTSNHCHHCYAALPGTTCHCVPPLLATYIYIYIHMYRHMSQNPSHICMKRGCLNKSSKILKQQLSWTFNHHLTISDAIWGFWTQLEDFRRNFEIWTHFEGVDFGASCVMLQAL